MNGTRQSRNDRQRQGRNGLGGPRLNIRNIPEKAQSKKIPTRHVGDFNQPVERWSARLSCADQSERKSSIETRLLGVEPAEIYCVARQRTLKCTQWRPTETHNQWITYFLRRTHARTYTHTQARTQQCPVMQRDSVSRDKAISRSEYRQTEGIVLWADTQDPHTHTQDTHLQMWQEILAEMVDGYIQTTAEEKAQKNIQVLTFLTKLWSMKGK